MNVDTIPRGVDDVEMSFGSLLKQKRSRLGLSQKDVSDATGIGLSHYKQIETDRSLPSLEKAVGLSSALNVDPREIFRELGADMPGVEGKSDAFQGDNGQPPPYEIQMVDGLRAIHHVFSTKAPTSRRLPRAIEVAEGDLYEADLDDLIRAATLMDYGFIDFPSQSDIDELSDEDRDATLVDLAHRMIIAALYGSQYELADRQTLEAVTNDIADRLYQGSGFIEGKGWFTEDDEAYISRLRSELAPHIVRAAKNQKAPASLHHDQPEEEE